MKIIYRLRGIKNKNSNYSSSIGSFGYYQKALEYAQKLIAENKYYKVQLEKCYIVKNIMKVKNEY